MGKFFLESKKLGRFARAPMSRKQQVHRVLGAADGVGDARYEIAGAAHTLTGDVAWVMRRQRLGRVGLLIETVNTLRHENPLPLSILYRKTKGKQAGEVWGLPKLKVSELFMGNLRGGVE